MARIEFRSAVELNIEESYRLLLDNVREFAIFILDLEGRITSWNEGAERLFGYTEDVILGLSLDVLFTPEDKHRGLPSEELERATRDGRWEEENWHTRADGSRFWGSGVLTALRDEAGALHGFAKITRDMTAQREASERLRESEERFRLLVEGVKEYAIFMLDAAGRIVTWNVGAESYQDYWGEEVQGQSLACFYAPEDTTAGEPQADLETAVTRGRCEKRSWRVRKDKSRFWAEIVLAALKSESGELQGFSLVMRDITERKQAEEQVERLAAFPRFNPNPVLEFDCNGTLLFHNAAAATAVRQLNRKELGEILPQDAGTIIQECLAKGKSRRGIEVTIEGRTLTWSFFPISLTNIVHGYAADITERKRAEEQLLHDAFHDPLTGLPNRALFMDHLRLAIERARRREADIFAVLFLDLDRFKVVNDSLGHMNGDHLLISISRRLQSCLRPGDTVARLGGDEFTILLEDIGEASEAIRVAERVQNEIMQPIRIDGHEVTTTTSIGVALSTTGYEHPEELLRDADTAMYRAKSLGKARHEVFDREMHHRAMELLRIESNLRRAVERNEFQLYYQPIIKLQNKMPSPGEGSSCVPLHGTQSSSSLCGFEALIRWQHPEQGMVEPEKFIPVAEETGLIVPLGEWVLRQACRQMREWQKMYQQASGMTISVNLSGRQIMQRNLIECMKDILEEAELDPGCLKLEITESAMMENSEMAFKMLDQLKRLGVELALDDFGTGYSSLSYLHRFPVQQLKIDRCFVSNMNGGEGADKNEAIVRTIVLLARNLNIAVVAEGVETADQLDRLQAMNCDYGQGFYLHRPMSTEDAGSLLRNATNNHWRVNATG